MPYGTLEGLGLARTVRRYRYEVDPHNPDDVVRRVYHVPEWEARREDAAIARRWRGHRVEPNPLGGRVPGAVAFAVAPFIVLWQAAPVLFVSLVGIGLLRALLDPLVKANRATKRALVARAVRAQKAMRVVHRASRREPPSRELLWRCWELSRASLEGKILLGALLGDADAASDHSYIRGEGGEIVGRRGGVRRWLDETCRPLMKHYKTLMRYKAMADKFRRVCGLADPDSAEDALGAPAELREADARAPRPWLPAPSPARLEAARAKARELLAAHRTL
ncbi:MAG: hypothetical protein IJ783_09990, partial [Kiritimatiellae bacterium]|nr:hypothetical protein [Kiritimatiellia bacterium]